MGEIVNLRRARKAQGRLQAEAKAQENRTQIRHEQGGAAIGGKNQFPGERQLEGHRREGGEPEGGESEDLA